MKRFRGINYGYHPKSYWETTDGLGAILRNVKGRERRAIIRDYWRKGRTEELDKALLKPALTKQERELLGKIHPVFMGGEYLPAYKPREVEIARIELDSATADVISIRARPQGNGIAYRIVDEYETRFRLARKTSREPLTLAGLVSLIEDSQNPALERNLALCYNELNGQGG